MPIYTQSVNRRTKGSRLAKRFDKVNNGQVISDADTVQA